MKVSVKDVVVIVGVIVGIYLLWKTREKMKEAGDKVAEVIADAYLGVTLPGSVSVNAQIRLPGGQLIDADEIVLKDNQRFAYLGTLYQLKPRGSDNIYGSVKVS